jgi:hypothetical protein
MARWDDLPAQIKTEILRTAVTKIARDVVIRQRKIRPALLFSYYRSMSLTCREFHNIISYVRIGGINIDIFLKRIQHQMASTLTSFAGFNWDIGGQNQRFLNAKAILGRFWRNPLVLSDPPVVIGLLETVVEPFRQWLLVQMEEFFTLNSQQCCYPGGYLSISSSLDCPVDEDGESLGVEDTCYFMITLGDREIMFQNVDLQDACSVHNITDVRYVLESDPPVSPWSLTIPEITKSSMGTWWYIGLNEIPDAWGWYLINFADGLVFIGDEEEIVTFTTILSNAQVAMSVMDEISRLKGETVGFRVSAEKPLCGPYWY